MCTNLNIIELDEANSTNTYLSGLLNSNPPHGTIVITRKQTQGRGQLTNKWESEDGRNLTFSMLLKPNIPIIDAFWISKAVSLGIVEVLNKFYQGFKIKWPNDIYYNDKKIAGILIENRLKADIVSHAIIGIGVNINQEVFISDAPNPISLKNIIGKESDLDEIFHQIIQSIMLWYNVLIDGNTQLINEKYHLYLYKKDERHQFKVNAQTITAIIKEVKPDGELIIKTDDNQYKGFYLHQIQFLQK